MNTDNAFFAAYGQPVTFDGGRGKSPKSRRSTPANDQSRHAASIDTQYTDVAWYRVDQRHHEGDGVPAPHTPRAAAQAKTPVEPTSALSPTPSTVDAGSPTTWDATDSWQSTCLVMAAPISIGTVPDAVESPAASVASLPSTDGREAAPTAPPLPVTEPAAASVAAAMTASEPVAAPAMVANESPAARPWMPQWEVDEFAWPDELLRLQDRQTDYFRYAGEKLRDASREGLKTMAVVSTREKEGSTTMAICLARAAAAAGARVALLDANLHHPELGPKLGLDFSHGWQESLDDPTTLAEAAVVALDSGLTLLPLSPAHRINALSDPRVARLVAEINAAFDLVIIDAGVAGDGEETWFADSTPRAVNAALVVRDLRRTSETETLVTASRLKLFGVDAVGIAENFTPVATGQTRAA